MGSEIGVGRIREGMIVPWWVPDENARRFVDASRYERYLWLWRECVIRGRNAERIASGRYLEIRYEELCEDPHGVGGRLVNFLEAEESRGFRKALDQARSSSIGTGRRAMDAGSAMWEPVAALLRELGYAGP